jgi:hypothetical protein
VDESLPIEARLEQTGYAPVSRVFVEVTDGPNGEVVSEGRYVKAISPDGHMVYVETDVDGYMVSSPDEVPLKEARTELRIPPASKRGDLRSVGLLAKGIAYECEGDICVVTRSPNNEMEPEEISLVRSFDLEKASEEEVGYPIPYPIVLFSDILSSPDYIRADISDAVQKLKVLAESKSKEELNKFMDSAENIANTSDQLLTEISTRIRELSSTLGELESVRSGYEAAPAIAATDLGRKNIFLINYNTMLRQEELSSLFKMSSDLNRVRNQMDAINQSIMGRIEYLKEHYNDLSFIQHPPM